MAGLFEQLVVRIAYQSEVAHGFVARHDTIEITFACDDQRGHRDAHAVGFEILPLGKACAAAHAAWYRRRSYDVPRGVYAGRESRAGVWMQRTHFTPPAAHGAQPK